MHARVIIIRGEPSKLDAAVERVQGEVVPELQASDGFEGFRLMVDRESGTIVGTSWFASREALEANDQRMGAPRSATVQAAGAPDPEVHFLEVAVDVAR